MSIPEKLSIGGVSFYKSDVKSYEVQNQGNTSLNTVFMKDGTKISFRDQDVKNKASIMMGVASATSEKGIKFSNVHLESLTGTDKKDYYYLNHSDVSNLDMGKNPLDIDMVKFVYNDSTKQDISLPSTINAGCFDDVVHINLSEQEFINMNEGFFYRTDKGL